MKTIKVRQIRHARHCWRSKDELISDVLLWTPSHGQVKVGWPAITYLQLLSANAGCSLEDLLEAMDDVDAWRERVREVRASSMIWCCDTTWKEKLQWFFNQWETHKNAWTEFPREYFEENLYLIHCFHFGKYSFSLDIFWEYRVYML